MNRKTIRALVLPALLCGITLSAYAQPATFIVQPNGKLTVNIPANGGKSFILDLSKINFKPPDQITVDRGLAARLGYTGTEAESYGRESGAKITAVNSRIKSMGGENVIFVTKGKDKVFTAGLQSEKPLTIQLAAGNNYKVATREIKTEALINAYNEDAGKHNEIFGQWQQLYNLHNDIYHFRDELLSSLEEDTIRAGTKALQRFNNIDTGYAKAKTCMTKMDEYIKAWAWYNKSKTLNPFSVAHDDVKNILFDTTSAIQQIEWLKPQLQNTELSPVKRNLVIERIKNYTIQLQLLRKYYEQLQVSDLKKKSFYGQKAIAEINVPEPSDFCFFHDAASSMKADNELGNRTLLNSQLVSIAVYNIPPGKSLKVDVKDSVIKTEELQFTRLANAFLDGFEKGSGTKNIFAHSLPSNYITSSQSSHSFNFKDDKELKITQILDSIGVMDMAILEYIAMLPPAEQIKLQDEPVDKAYKMETEIVKKEDNVNSHIYTYTLGFAGDDAKNSKSFRFKKYRVSRLQFTGGVHLPTGDASVVKYDNNGHYSVESDNRLKYSLGLKYYLFSQTFRDRYGKDIASAIELSKSLFVHFGVDAAYPLNNFYTSVGFDIIPGLGASIGLQSYKYTTYTIVNGQQVGTSYNYKLRRGATFNLLMDMSVITRTFTNFLHVKK
jgi:hypothetical protein